MSKPRIWSARIWSIRLTDREVTQILAALRYWQQAMEAGENPASQMDHFSEDNQRPLTQAEIDELCERINLEA